MADIKYERNGVVKVAGEQFKSALASEGWSVVEEDAKPEKTPAKKPNRKSVAKDE